MGFAALWISVIENNLRSSWITGEQGHNILSKIKYKRCQNNYKAYLKASNVKLAVYNNKVSSHMLHKWEKGKNFERRVVEDKYESIGK